MENPTTAGEIELEWLREFLAKPFVGCELRSFELDASFAPVSLISRVSRVYLRWADGCDAPSSLIFKFPSDQPEVRSRATAGRIYAREAANYELLGQHPGLSVAKYYGAFDAGEEDAETLVIEDLGAYRSRAQTEVCSVVEIVEVLDGIADIHAAFWGDGRLPPRSPDRMVTTMSRFAATGWPMLLEAFGTDLRGTRNSWDWYLENMRLAAGHTVDGPGTLINFDLHVENLLFPPDAAARIKIVDWQLGGRGNPAHDVSLLLRSGLSVEERRASEDDLLNRYHSRLTEKTGVVYSFEDLRLDYRAAMCVAMNRVLAAIGAFGGVQVRDDRSELSSKLFDDAIAVIEDHDPVDALKALDGAPPRRGD